ncbi:MAG: cupin domain-containing protein [Candidatus Methylophosphatis roskildensis]
MLDNLFSHLPACAENDERFDTLLERPGLKIERIVSTGQSSPPGFWYDQCTAEWIVVLQGEAVLRLEGESQSRTLRVGDFLEIPARVRHRVEATSIEAPTVWLAIHY